MLLSLLTSTLRSTATTKTFNTTSRFATTHAGAAHFISAPNIMTTEACSLITIVTLACSYGVGASIQTFRRTRGDVRLLPSRFTSDEGEMKEVWMD